MALFGNKETKEEKQARLEQEMLEANHLTEISADLSEDVASIIKDITMNGIVAAQVALRNNHDSLNAVYMRALIAQNWIIIRLLDRIANK
jgi:hypothetical protein